MSISPSFSQTLPTIPQALPTAPHSPAQRHVYLQTWGCQMNVADSQRMLAILKTLHYAPTDTVEEADLIILNTCHIREKAYHKVLSRLGELKPLKYTIKQPIMAVAGCIAQGESKKLAKSVPFLDLIFGPDQIETLPQLLAPRLSLENSALETVSSAINSKSSQGPTVQVGFDKAPTYSIPTDVIPPFLEDNKTEVSKFINIIKGCNNFCTFCVVPHTRGREKSRPVGEIVQESLYFTEHNVKEIVLLGQNVNSYGLDLLGEEGAKAAIENDVLPFAQLLYAVAKVPGVQRIRFCTSNPHDFTPSLAKAFGDIPALCNNFHLPVQSGSDRILDRMNRQYTTAQYYERVNWIRAVRPEMAFTTDIIVGFPGETEEDFEGTLDLVRRMEYASIFAFKYSIRPKTPAARFHDQVPEDVKDRRLQTLFNLQKQITEAQNQRELGQTRELLFLYRSRKNPQFIYGRTSQGRLVKVESQKFVVGDLTSVTITQANAFSLTGQ